MSNNNSSRKNDKHNKRPGVQHTYRDYANVSIADVSRLFHSSFYGPFRQHNPLAQGSQQQGFAVKLHYMLEDIDDSGDSHIVSWQPHGRSFLVHNRDLFVEKILPNYFLQTTYASFQRQLNLYGFKRISSGQDKGGYYHELFLRTKSELACFIQRIKRKGEGPRKPDSPDTEPDFYSMPYLPPSTEKEPRTGVTTREALLEQHPMPSCQQQQEQQFAQFQQQFMCKPSGSGGLSLRNLLPASLGTGHFQQLQQQNQVPIQPAPSSNSGSATSNPYNIMLQPKPLLSSDYGHEMESSVHLSEALQRQLEPTPIHPASSRGSSANNNSNTDAIGSGNSNNGNDFPSNTLPLDAPPPLWGFGSQMAQTTTTSSSNSADQAGNGSSNDCWNPSNFTQWQNMFTLEEEELWPNRMGI